MAAAGPDRAGGTQERGRLSASAAYRGEQTRPKRED